MAHTLLLLRLCLCATFGRSFSLVLARPSLPTRRCRLFIRFRTSRRFGVDIAGGGFKAPMDAPCEGLVRRDDPRRQPLSR